jgi:hypothetical protein
LHSSPDIIRQIRSRRMRCAGHVAHMGEETCTRFWWESPKESDHFEDQGIEGRMGLEWILGRLAGGGGVEWIHLIQVRDRFSGSSKSGGEPSGSGSTELVSLGEFRQT